MFDNISERKLFPASKTVANEEMISQPINFMNAKRHGEQMAPNKVPYNHLSEGSGIRLFSVSTK